MTATATAPAPRRSRRVGTAGNGVPEDLETNGIWEEKLAVCEGATPDGQPKLLIRSYYYRDGDVRNRVWDEPPSGAGAVIHATPEDRQRAEVQMTDLQLTLDMIPPDDVDDINAASNAVVDVAEKKELKKKKGLLGRFRGGSSNSSSKKSPKPIDTARDLNLQRAIARSMTDTGGQQRISSPGLGLYYEAGAGAAAGGGTDDEDLALAKALSMGVETNPQTNDNSDHTDLSNLSEDEMMRLALEESKISAMSNGVPDGAVASEDATPPATAAAVADNSIVTSSEYYDDDNDYQDSIEQSHPVGFGKTDPNERHELV